MVEEQAGNLFHSAPQSLSHPRPDCLSRMANPPSWCKRRLRLLSGSPNASRSRN